MCYAYELASGKGAESFTRRDEWADVELGLGLGLRGERAEVGHLSSLR